MRQNICYKFSNHINGLFWYHHCVRLDKAHLLDVSHTCIYLRNKWKIEVLDFHNFSFHKLVCGEELPFDKFLYPSNFNTSEVMRQNIATSFQTT